MDNEKEYKRICKKLGFIPAEVGFPDTDEEDDNIENPFSILSSEEIDFLINNGYLIKQ